jgi:hypothetical protein
VLHPVAVVVVVVIVVVVVVVMVVVVVLDDYRIPFTGSANLSVKFSQLSTIFIVCIKSCLAWVL